MKPYVDALIGGVESLSVLFILFALLERMFSIKRSKKPLRETLLDFGYAFLSMFYQPFISFLISLVFGLLAIHLTADDPGRPDALDFGMQLVMVLFVRDCLIYIRHRIFHTRHVWAFHSVHHSSEELDWISAVRFHPAENMLETFGEIALVSACMLVGIAPSVLAVMGFVVGVYNSFIHANLRWTFGPLGYLFVSPVFHRWHHSDRIEARDKNFAAMFSIIDLLLGTFYMPDNVMPETLGLSEEEKEIYPRTFTGQLLYPFQRGQARKQDDGEKIEHHIVP